ncbi:hypothetical protein IAI13_32595, partial [Escherichia coli]|nr:hypothetical protein [Escherichia coli]
ALSNAVNTITGALGNVGGAGSPLAPVQGVVTQLAGTLGNGDPAGALTNALNSVTGALGGANPLAPVQGVVNQVVGTLG